MTAHKQGLTEAIARIAEIDRGIDALLKELCSLVPRFRRTDAGGWQEAWDRHPQLKARLDDLYRQRGEAQEERDGYGAAMARLAARRASQYDRRRATKARGAA